VSKTVSSGAVVRRVWVPAALHAGEQCVCVNQEILTFTGLLNRQATTYEAMAALRNSTSAVVAARAKKAVACLLWMSGQPAAELEQMVMRHRRDRNPIGPSRAQERMICAPPCRESVECTDVNNRQGTLSVGVPITVGDRRTGGKEPVAEILEAGCVGQRVAVRVVGLFAADARR
jgi:hypothetical protein